MYPLWLQLEQDNPLGLELDVWQINVSNPTPTTASVDVSAEPDVVSYGYEVVPISSNFTNTFTYSNSLPISISGLTAGTQYNIQVRGYSSSNGSGIYGYTRSRTFTTPVASNNASVNNQSTKETDTSSTNSGGPTGANKYYNYYTGEWVDDPSKIVPRGYTSSSSSTASSSSSSSNSSSSGSSSSSSSSTNLNGDPKVNVDSIRKAIESSTKSFLKLSNDSVDKDNYTIAYKQFSQLNTSNEYFVFGTSLFFESKLDKPKQSGGIGFFVDNLGKDGYFINIETTALSAIDNRKEFSIYKVKGGVVYQLTDSQSGGISKSLNGVFGGKLYKIDVKVKRTSSKVDITVFVNGFKITATDENPSAGVKAQGGVGILPATNKLALRCQEGVVYFDYIYGMHLDQKKFELDSLFNLYQGQFSNAAFSFLYGNTLLENQSISNNVVGGFLEEFGPVAREIKFVNTKYDSRPAFPLYTSIGINPFAQVLGERLTSFGAKVFVVNNTGTSIPLDDSGTYSFFIVGKYINQSGTIEYVDNSASDFDVQEPVQFESTWIQKLTDAKALGDWVKSVWSKKNLIVKLQVFGNPLLSVGDIIAINYPYNDLSDTGGNAKKFVITSISHNFEEGLETTLVCRTL